MMDTREYEQLALESGVYRDIELDILMDTLEYLVRASNKL